MSSFIADNPATLPSSSADDLRSQLQAATPAKQLPLIAPLLALGEPGLAVLMDFLVAHQATPTITTGRIYQKLRSRSEDQVQQFLQDHFPHCVYALPASCQVDYSDVQRALGAEDFETADRLTLAVMCELAGPTAIKRNWFYFTEVAAFPVVDLQTLDRLWQIYSEGRFGFARQRELWLGLGKNWERLWPQIGWKQDNLWTRYPGGFIWDLNAPVGHLPLSNQLRGVRAMEALLVHPAWTQG